MCVQAESRLEELQYQRDATEAELRALEQKVMLLDGAVKLLIVMLLDDEISS